MIDKMSIIAMVCLLSACARARVCVRKQTNKAKHMYSYHRNCRVVADKKLKTREEEEEEEECNNIII